MTTSECHRSKKSEHFSSLKFIDLAYAYPLCGKPQTQTTTMGKMLTALYFSFLISEVRVIIAPTPLGCCEHLNVHLLHVSFVFS